MDNMEGMTDNFKKGLIAEDRNMDGLTGGEGVTPDSDVEISDDQNKIMAGVEVEGLLVSAEENTKSAKKILQLETTQPVASSSKDVSKANAKVKTSQLVLDPPLPFGESRQMGVPLCNLYAGSKFKGHQFSRNETFKIEAAIKYVDWDDDIINGYMTIRGLPGDFPPLTTYFEGEIIGKKHPFLTRKWGTTAEIDRRHWTLFNPFSYYSDTWNTDDCPYDYLKYLDDVVFMRLKEKFMVPDHNSAAPECVHDGFYYMCFSKSCNILQGYYFSRFVEWFQYIRMDHIRDATTQVFEFR